MRAIEKAVAIFILAMSGWAILMWTATSFQGNQSNRILLVELGSDAASLNQAVAANGKNDIDGIAHNIKMVVRNTYMDFVFILLYWLTFVSLAVLAGRLGQRFLAACAAIFISVAAVGDLLENSAILIAMGVKPFTDPVAVDISEYSQLKWASFFLALLLLGLAIALNRRVSNLRRASGGLFIAGALFGSIGIVRYRVSLDVTIVMFAIAMMFIVAAFLLTLWKIYHSLKEIDRLKRTERAHA